MPHDRATLGRTDGDGLDAVVGQHRRREVTQVAVHAGRNHGPIAIEKLSRRRPDRYRSRAAGDGDGDLGHGGSPLAQTLKVRC